MTTTAPARTGRRAAPAPRASGFGAAHLVRRQLAAAPGALVLLAVTALMAALLVTAWPRAVDRLLAEHLATEVGTLSAARLEPSVVALHWAPRHVGLHGAEVLEAEAHDLAAEARAEAGPTLLPALGDVTVTAESTRTPVEKGPRADDVTAMSLVMRVDVSLPDRVRVVEGDLPAPVDDAALAEALAEAGSVRTVAEDAAPVDLLLSTDTADRMGWEVGETRRLAGAFPWPMRLAGTFEARDTRDGYWSHLESTLRPYVEVDWDLGTFVHGTAYLDPSALHLMAMTGSVHRHHWFGVDRDAVAEAPTAALVAELRGFEAGTGTRSELGPTLAATLDQQRTLTTLLTVLAVGPTGAALGLTWLAARLAVERRRRALDLARARGASRTGLALAVAAQGAAVALPAAAAGAALATAGVPGPVRAGHYVLPALLGTAPAVLLALAAAAPRPVDASPATVRRARRRRAALEVLVVVLAALAIVSVRQRGLVHEGAGGDPVLLALPVLLVLAVTVLVLRAYPWPMRALARALARGRGLVGAVGPAVATRAPAPTTSVVALVLAVAVTVLAGVTFSTVRAGIAETAARTAGADLRLVDEGLTDDDVAVLAELDGVGAAVAVREADAEATAGRTTRGVALVVVDAGALAAVHAGIDATDRVRPLPRALAEPGDGALPAVVSARLAGQAGDLTLSVGDRTVPLEPVASATAVPGVAAGGWWVVVDRDRLADALGDAPAATATARVLVDLAGASADDVRDVAADLTGGDVSWSTPGSVAARLRAAPLVAGMETGLAVVTAASAVLGVGVVVLTLALGGPARDRRTALLATLGAPRRSARRLLRWEVVPLVVVAGLTGGVVGVALPLVLLPTARLRPFTGGTGEPELTADPALAAAVGAVALVATALATAVAARRATRTDPARVLREGDPS